MNGAAADKRGATQSEQLSVLLADNDISYRQLVREALGARNRVVGEAHDAAAAIGAATRMKPDICTIEIELPREGLNVTSRIAKASPQTMIVVLSHSDRPEDVVSSFARGASGYLLKGINGEQLAAPFQAHMPANLPCRGRLSPTSSRRSAVARFAGWHACGADHADAA